MPANTIINNIREDTIAIDNGVFYHCINLTSITIPTSVTSVGEQAFGGWDSQQTINVQGKTQAVADAMWGANWRQFCYATINYNG